MKALKQITGSGYKNSCISELIGTAKDPINGEELGDSALDRTVTFW
jgi:hypothetical protein